MQVIKLILRWVFRRHLCIIQVKISWFHSQCIEEKVACVRAMFCLLASCLVTLICIFVLKEQIFCLMTECYFWEMLSFCKACDTLKRKSQHVRNFWVKVLYYQSLDFTELSCVVVICPQSVLYLIACYKQVAEARYLVEIKLFLFGLCNFGLN